MSAQTIIHPSISSMVTEAEDAFIKNSEKLLLEDFYALGKGYCNFEQADAAMLYDIIQTNNCGLLDLINKELHRIEDDPEEDKRPKLDIYTRSNQSLYELWLSKGNMGTMEDFLCLILADDKANWDEIKW